MSMKIPSEYYGCEFEVTEAHLNDDPPRTPGTVGWLLRFDLVTTSDKWPMVNAAHVDEVIDRKGDWIADFPEPTPGNPTVL